MIRSAAVYSRLQRREWCRLATPLLSCFISVLLYRSLCDYRVALYSRLNYCACGALLALGLLGGTLPELELLRGAVQALELVCFCCAALQWGRCTRGALVAALAVRALGLLLLRDSLLALGLLLLRGSPVAALYSRRSSGGAVRALGLLLLRDSLL
jgi:hypothetical protein